MEITCRIYRPRRASESPLYRLVDAHLEELLGVWPERFAKAHGALRPVVERVLRGFLTCGIVSHGFARLWCAECETSVLCLFSCRGRSFCPSCEKKRQLLWAEWLQKEVLEPVPHRHVVLTMPRLLRGIFRKRRELLLDLSQCAAEAIAEYVKRQIGADTRPGIVVSIATAGDLVQWHPHGHLLLTDGGFSDDGAFHSVPGWDGEAVMKLFRECLFARLIERHAISEELARRLLAWRHPRFSAHVGDAHYANRVRGERPPEEVTNHEEDQEQPKKRRCPPTWARLIAKVFQANPLVCKRCGGPLKVVAYITDSVAIGRILDHCDLIPPEKPPPEVRDVVRVPLDDEGREIAANPA